MLKKQFLKTKEVCKVTFSLPEAVQGETVFLVGDFNNWDEFGNADEAPEEWKLHHNAQSGQRTGLSISVFSQWYRVA